MIKENDLPDGWKKYTLKNIGTIVTGSTPPKKDAENYGGDLPWIKPPDLDKKMFIFSSKDNISDIGRNKVRLLPKGSVLVSCIGNIGKIAVADCELCTNQQINSIIPNTEIVDSIFLYYLMKKIKPNLENMASSAVVPLLNKSDFSNVVVSLPPPQTQKKIVAILEKAERLKEWRKEADELTDEFLKSTFLEMFGDPIANPKGWEETPLSNISKIDKNAISPENITAGTKYVGLEHIESNTGNIIEITSLNENELKSTKFLFTSEHVLYGKLRPYLNKVSLPYFDGVCSTDILPISPNKDKSNKYFIAFLLKHSYYVELATKLSIGANLPRISPKEIANFDVFCPPLELQEKFASIVQQVEQLREHQSQSKQHIDDLFNVLMQKAFKGDLI